MKIHTLALLAFYFSWQSTNSITVECNNSWTPLNQPNGSQVRVGGCFLTDTTNDKEMKVEGTHPDPLLIQPLKDYFNVYNQHTNAYSHPYPDGSGLVYLYRTLKKDEKITTFCSEDNCVSLPRHSGFYKLTIDNQSCPTITKLLFISNNKQIALCITSTEDKQAENHIHIEDSPQQYQVIYLSTDVLFKKATLSLSLPVLESTGYEGFVYTETLKGGKSLEPVYVTHSNGDGKEKTKFVVFDYSQYAYGIDFTIVTASMPSIEDKPNTLYTIRTDFGRSIVYKEGDKVLLESYYSNPKGPIQFRYSEEDYKSLEMVAIKSGFSTTKMSAAYKNFQEQDPMMKSVLALQKKDDEDEFLILLSNVSRSVKRKDLGTGELLSLQNLIKVVSSQLISQQEDGAVPVEAGSNPIAKKWELIENLLRDLHKQSKVDGNKGEIAEMRKKALDRISFSLRNSGLVDEKKDKNVSDPVEKRKRNGDGDNKDGEKKEKKKPFPEWVKVMALGIVICIVGGVVFVVVRRRGKKEIKVVEPELAAISEAFV